jgi:lysophospholipase L1-like esterase
MTGGRDRLAGWARAHWAAVASVGAVCATVAVGLGLAAAAPAQHRHVRLIASIASVDRDIVTARRAGLPPPQRSHWVSTWSASPQAATPGSVAEKGFSNQTVRNVVFASVGGTKVRVMVTNAFGTQPLTIGHAAVGPRSHGAGVVATHNVALSFRGRRSVVIPAGAAVLSDPVSLRVLPLHELVVSLFAPKFTGPATQHAVAQQLNYVATGDHVLDHGGGAFATPAYSWFFISSVDVLAGRSDLGSIVALGDSITDGVNSTVSTNSRWPNDLARRIHKAGQATLSVVDEGIGGNRLLSNTPCCGVSAIARFKRDVLHRAGVREVILLEGVNDIGQSQHGGAASAPHTPVTTDQLIAGYKTLIRQAHAAHLTIIGGTILPFEGARYWSQAGEDERGAVNHWILTSGAFDDVIDFASAVADPDQPTRLDPAYDSGDHLHPNRAGYRAMANAVDLNMVTAAAR